MRYGLIVDGYSSGSELVAEFNKLGIICLHIQSKPKIPDIYVKTFHPTAYLKNFIYHGQLKPLLRDLQAFKTIFVVAGSEPGVELADLIAHSLGLINANPLATSLLRRDKFLMQEQLKEKGLASIPQYKSSSLIDVLSWTEHFAQWPLVIKPLKSAGGDKVKICYSKEDVKVGFNEIVTQAPNFLGDIDSEVLIQEYIDSATPEFAVNTVQYQGVSYLCEVWEFIKILCPNGRKIYDCANLLSPGNYTPSLIDYAFEVAKALNIFYGPMHAEVLMTPKGPVLIEAAARLMGANLPATLMGECLLNSQILMTALAYGNPDSYLEKARLPNVNYKHLKVIFLISTVRGKFIRIRHLEKIQKLPSFYGIKIRLDDQVFPTTDYNTSPGLIYLRHEDPEIIWQDYLLIRELEKEMYEVA